MAEPKIKANKLSIYLIKSEYKRVEDIVESAETPVPIEGVGHFIFEESHPHKPDWVTDFFGTTLDNELNILTSSAKGMLVVPVRKGGETIFFALAFGVGRHLLRDGVVEDRFGLKVVLNSLEIDSFRSIDKTTLGSVPKHSHEEMTREVSPAEFGIDVEQDLISSVTGKTSEDALFGKKKTITGKDALSLSAPVDVTNVRDFLSGCYDRYKSENYKKNFEWIDQISDVRDGKLEDALNAALVERVQKNELEKVWMAVPDVVNWSDIRGFRYFKRVKAGIFDDLFIQEFIRQLGDTPITLEVMKRAQIFMISATNDDVMDNWSAYRCMYAEVEMDGRVFILNNGKWYEIAKGFTEQVKKDYAGMTESSLALPVCEVNKEKEYNEYAASALAGACCMDQEMISHGGGHSSIEFCDIYTSAKQLVHVKKYGGSSVLSHLFMQGVVSGELFATDGDFREKLNAKLPATHKLSDPRINRPNPAEHEVVYAIISESEKALDIPFFSKVSLRNAKRRLTGYGYPVTLKKIQKTRTN